VTGRPTFSPPRPAFGSRLFRLALGSVLLATLSLVLPRPAAAHGPTVRVAYGAIRPAVLTIRKGETVHFLNANTGGGPCTVVAEDGSFRSPVMERAGGWHMTFDEAGSFPFFVEEYSKAKGLVIVVEE